MLHQQRSNSFSQTYFKFKKMLDIVDTGAHKIFDIAP